MDNQNLQLYFEDGRLKMKAISRSVSRLIAYCGYIIFVVATIIFLFLDIFQLFWLGILNSLFLIDRLIHIGQAEKSLSDFNPKKETGRKINVSRYFAPASLLVLERAFDKSLFVGGNFYLHLAKLLVVNREIHQAFLRMGVSAEETENRIDDLFAGEKDKKSLSRDELFKKVETLAKIAFILAANSRERFIGAGNLFSALSLVHDERIDRLFGLFAIEPKDLDNALIFGKFQEKAKLFRNLPVALGGFVREPHRIRHRYMNRAWTARPTPTLDKFSTDFTDLARLEKTGFLIGHEEEYDRIVDILSRPSKPNALLVGEPGSGKETLISHLAFEIIKDRVPALLLDKRLVALQIGNLVSGAKADEVAARVNKIIEEIISAGNVILYFPDIHNLVKTSGLQNLSAADIFLPIIQNDAFPVIGSTYPREFKQVIEPQTDFSGSFDVIMVEEVSEDEATKILTYESIILERQYKLIISFGAIKQAVYLAHKYFRTKLLPSSAEDLLKEALADASQKNNKILQANDVVAIAERKSKIPIHQAGKEEAEQLLNLESTIHERLVDQEEAVVAVSRALREYRSGLSRKGGPIAVFLFVGPTGVGKTELSKILAKLQFGSESLMLRFDMSEYQNRESIYRFIGSPDGKIAGNLTETIIQKPYSLILLDEFEKANSDILNLFLQVFDDGRLTDNLGRTIDFTNTIIIATSNAHSDFVKTSLEAGKTIESISEELKKKLTDYFRPELLNRFSDIIVFKTLSADDVLKIAELNLRDLAKSVAEAQKINLVFEDSAIKRIAELGYSPIFGARPLRAVISDNLRSVMAEKILKREIIPGSTVKTSFNNNEFRFEATE